MRRGLIGTLVAGLVASPLALGFTTAPAQAASATVVINEVYVNGGSANATYTNKYVELRNLTGADISLTGMSVQYRAPGSTGNSTSTAALTGTIPANGYYVVSGGSNGANGVPVPITPGQAATGINPGAAGGTLTLVTGTTAVDPSASSAVVDKVGYGTSNTPEGTAASGNSVTMSLGRTGASTDTDANSTDFGAQAPTPGASNGGGTDPGGALAATNPGTKTATTGAAITPFTLAASGGTSPYAWSATGLPTGLSISTAGQVSGTPTAAGSYSVVATVTDAAATPATATTTFTYTVSDPGAQSTIAQIQGTTDTTPFAGQVVTTTGVVTAAYPTGGLNGFYLQTGGPDTTPDASDGIFVFAGTNLPAASYPAVGSTVTVSGTAKEFVVNTKNQTEIELGTTGTVTAAATAQPAVVAKTVVPGTDCAEGSCPTATDLNAAREKVESEAFAPSGAYTATDVYDGSPAPSTSSANFGEIGLAAGTRALIQPTDLYDAQTETAQIAARNLYNDAHRIILDDASSLNYTLAANTGTPIPWFTPTHYVRNGASVTFPQQVIMTQAFDGWTFLPSGGQITGDPTGKVNFSQNRPAAPGDVGGEIKLATFNVLNFFPTTGNEFVSSGLGSCTYYTDRAGAQVTNNTCGTSSAPGPRGAANAANLQRQQDKIVHAINALGASIVSLEELENSIWFNKDRDFAINVLVTALNADAGAGTWAFAPSPAAADLPAKAEQDVIRSGFIYKPAQVALVGPSKVLVGSTAFGNAREPLAQGFKKVGTPDNKAFAVIVNHFKSKGSGTDDGTGQGNANPDRVNQAIALKAFASTFSSTLAGTGAVFLTGDFNAYSHEDPVQKLEENGDYTELDSTTTPGEDSYNFGGLDGSLDHVFANAKALSYVTGVDIWNINGDESVYQEYSRFNYNVTNLYNTTPYRSSDHNPEIVGLTVDPAVNTNVDLQIVATNDFHGRIQNDTSSTSAGAAVLAGAVKQLRTTNPNTTFVAAGDLIGASTFESFIQKDKPTIDALNEAGLEVSAVGNHEFDQGYNDLVNRVMAPYDAQTNPYGGANWKYLGANVKFKASGNPALDGTWMKTQDGVQVGYIGAVTEHLPELVAPGGISDIQVTNIVTAANGAADELKAAGADVIVLLVHEGAAGTDCATINSDTTSDFGKITSGVNANVDAIVSGHTHLVYNCSQPVAAWAGRPVTTRPIVSAGQYGSNLNQLVFSVDPTTGVVQAKTQSVLPLKVGTTGSSFNYPVDANTKTIVDNAVAQANVLGAQPLGQIGGLFSRAKLADGTTENRGGESTLGNLVAEIQKTQTSSATTGSAQIAFMNPGGLRADLAGQGTAAFPRTLTYKDAANVQPFANTLVNEALTGAQIKAALEQQWQPAGASRPFLKLGISKGFTYTYDPNAAQGSRIKAMYLNGTPIDLATTYSVTVNSFLSTGGDNFTALNGTARKQDTGVTDLQAQVDYFAALNGAAAPVDYSQRAVGATVAGTPTAGSNVAFDLTSLSMTGPGDVVDTSVTVSLDGVDLGTAPVTTTVLTALPGNDEAGTASVMVPLPATASGAKTLVVTGNNTGTVTRIPVTIAPAPSVATTVTGTAANVVYGQAGSLAVTVTAPTGTPTGTVAVTEGATALGTVTLSGGTGTLALPAKALEVGAHTLTLTYAGATGFDPSTGTATVSVVKATPTLTAAASPATVTYKKTGNRIVALVAPEGYVPTGTVQVKRGDTVIGTGTLGTNGAVSIPVGPYAAVGTFTFTVAYLGDTHTEPASKAVTVRVVKQTPVMKVTAPKSAKKNTRPTVKVALTATGAVVGGKVTFTVAGKKVTRTLAAGKASFQLPKLKKKTTVVVTYTGSGVFNAVTKRVTITLKK